MKNILVLFLLCASIAFAWPNAGDIQVPAGATLVWDNSSATWRPMGAAVGMVHFATRTVSIPAGTKVNVVANIPAGCQAVEFRAFGDELLVNDRLGLATGAICVGWSVSSGATRIWDGPLSGDMWIAARNGLAATFTMCGW